MRRRHLFSALLMVALATTMGHAQRSDHPRQQIGRLKKLTSTEIDLEIDDHGKPVIIVFTRAQNAKCAPAKIDAVVNISFVIDEKGLKIAEALTEDVNDSNAPAPPSTDQVDPAKVSEATPEPTRAPSQQASAAPTTSEREAVPESQVASIQQRLAEEIPLTKTTADRSDIVAPGAVVILHKDGLAMYSTTASTPFLNIYKDGRIQRNETHGGSTSALMRRFNLGKLGASDGDIFPHRNFVAGEKFWVTSINMLPDGAVLNVFSDPYNDVRYYGQLKFPYPKNSPPSAEEMLRTITEVISVQPGEGDKAETTQKQNSGQQQSSSAATAAIPSIAPPPPPADQPPAAPKTVAKGQSKDDVIANWGPPTKIVKLSNKEIYFYPDMKVTFVNGKVVDVQ